MLTIFGIAISLLLPLHLSPSEYGYWQLFALYVGFAGIFMFGFNDGIHLNYAGTHYEPSVFVTLRSFRVVVLSLSCLGSASLVLASIVVSEGNKQWILRGMAAYVLMSGLNGFCAYSNQNTLRFREYSRAIVLERLAFLLLALLLVELGVRDFRWYMAAAVGSCLALLLYNVLTSFELFWGPRIPLGQLKREIWSNFSQGFFLMIALILNQSMTVVGRLLVESRFGIAEFGGYSFALTVLNVAGLVMISVSQVTFPVIRRVMHSEVLRVSRLIDVCTSIVGALLLFAYFPVWAVVQIGYPSYRGMLTYLPYFFPLVIFQGKYQLIVVNGFKVAGVMSRFLAVSVTGVLVEIVACMSSILFAPSVTAVVIATVVGYVVAYYVGVWTLASTNDVSRGGVNYLDLASALAFMVACLIPVHLFGAGGWCGLGSAFAAYIALLGVALLWRRRRIVSVFRELGQVLPG